MYDLPKVKQLTIEELVLTDKLYYIKNNIKLNETQKLFMQISGITLPISLSRSLHFR